LITHYNNNNIVFFGHYWKFEALGRSIKPSEASGFFIDFLGLQNSNNALENNVIGILNLIK